jgi:putative PIN family toxin of toxin-antitoxin system
MTPRLVIDTNVVLAALRSAKGASSALMLHVAEARVKPLLTVALVLELESVLCRPEQLAATGLTRELVQGFVDELCALAEPVQIHFAWRPMLHDAADEMVLEAAVNGQADALVTFNLKDFLPAASGLGVEVTAPVTALRVFDLLDR